MSKKSPKFKNEYIGTFILISIFGILLILNFVILPYFQVKNFQKYNPIENQSYTLNHKEIPIGPFLVSKQFCEEVSLINNLTLKNSKKDLIEFCHFLNLAMAKNKTSSTDFKIICKKGSVFTNMGKEIFDTYGNSIKCSHIIQTTENKVKHFIIN